MRLRLDPVVAFLVLESVVLHLVLVHELDVIVATRLAVHKPRAGLTAKTTLGRLFASLLLVRFDFCHNSKYSILRAFARGLALGIRIMRFCLHPLYSLVGKKDVTGRMQQRDCEAKRSVDKELMPIREPKLHVGTGFRIHVTHELRKPFGTTLHATQRTSGDALTRSRCSYQRVSRHAVSRITVWRRSLIYSK